MIISSPRGRPSKGLGARPHAREKGGEEVRSEATLSLKQLKKMERLTGNIEILVKPSEFFNSISVIFLLCHFSLLQYMCHD